MATTKRNLRRRRPGAGPSSFRRNLTHDSTRRLGHSAQPPLTSQSLKEDENRAKYQGNAPDYATDGVRGSLRLGNQIEQEEANDQEDDEPLDPRHLRLLILPILIADYSNTCWMYRRKPGCSPARAQTHEALPHDQGELTG
jgi:hypothetical protein